MSQPFQVGVGAVLSADIAVPEHERELRFYSRVLGTGEAPLWREDLINNLGVPVIGLGARAGEYDGLPIQWMPHVQVADVAASVGRALELGGRALMHHRDAEGRSQWAVLQDRDGAAFGVIPVVPPEGIPAPAGGDAPDPAPVGRIAWLDLTVPDAAAAREFYREVVGWSVEEVPMKAGAEGYADYNMLGPSGTPAAGVCHARGVNAALPPVWMIYLPVGDLEESLRRVEEEGGEVIASMRGGDGGLAYAAVRDPAGAYFSLVPG